MNIVEELLKDKNDGKNLCEECMTKNWFKWKDWKALPESQKIQDTL